MLHSASITTIFIVLLHRAVLCLDILKTEEESAENNAGLLAKDSQVKNNAWSYLGSRSARIKLENSDFFGNEGYQSVKKQDRNLDKWNELALPMEPEVNSIHNIKVKRDTKYDWNTNYKVDTVTIVIPGFRDPSPLETFARIAKLILCVVIFILAVRQIAKICRERKAAKLEKQNAQVIQDGIVV